MGHERKMTSYLRNLQLCACCERAPPSDCSEKYCSGYSVLHFSPKTTLLHRGLTKVHWALPTQHLPKIWFTEQPALNTHTQDYSLSPEVNTSKCVTFQHYSILGATFLRPRASCAFVDSPEGGAQNMKNRKGSSYLHPLFQQLFPKLWDSSCFSHHMTSTVMVGFNEQISFRGRFTVRSCTFCVVNLAWTAPAHLLPLLPIINSFREQLLKLYSDKFLGIYFVRCC